MLSVLGVLESKNYKLEICHEVLPFLVLGTYTQRTLPSIELEHLCSDRPLNLAEFLKRA